MGSSIKKVRNPHVGVEGVWPVAIKSGQGGGVGFYLFCARLCCKIIARHSYIQHPDAAGCQLSSVWKSSTMVTTDRRRSDTRDQHISHQPPTIYRSAGKPHRNYRFRWQQQTANVRILITLLGNEALAITTHLTGFMSIIATGLWTRHAGFTQARATQLITRRQNRGPFKHCAAHARAVAIC